MRQLLTIVASLLVVVPWLVGQGNAAAGDLPQVKLTTKAEGIHRVTADSLAPLLGLTPDAVRQRIAQGGFALLNRGQPIGWVPGPTVDEVLFYAQALWNNYTETNVFWLVEGSNLPVTAVDAGAPAAVRNGWFMALTNCEQDIYCRYELGTHPDSNYWFWANLVGGHPFRGKFESGVMLDAPAPGDLDARLTVRVHGATTTNHTLALAVNGTTNAAWIGTWSDELPAEFAFDFSSTLLRQGSNDIRFDALGTFSTQWWLDGFRLEYPRLFSAANGQLICGANSFPVVTLAGFTSPTITVLDISQPFAPRVLTNLALESVAGAWRVSFVPSAPDARIAACQSGAAFDVLAAEAVWPVGLASPTNRAACVVIAPTMLLAAAQPLVDYRNAQGLETKLVSLPAVYNEFGSGFPEPDAIRSFLAYAWSYWQVRPAYVLLMGNGTYDYRDLRAVGDNLMPPLMVPSLYGLTASDSAYGETGSNVVSDPAIAVGRLPAVNAAQLAALIAKIKTYETAPAVPDRQAILMADVPDAAGDFVADVREVQAVLAGAFTNRMILPGDPASMRGLLLSNLNLGADLFCYLGHGGSDRLGNSTYLASSDVPSLAHGLRLPLVSAVTCLAGFFAEPGYDCLAETLVLSNQQGAIAVFSASGFSLDDEANDLNLGLMAGFASGTPGRLGDFVRQAMVEYNQVPRFTPSAMYGILGDPALLFRGAALPLPLPPSISALHPDGHGNMVLTLVAQPGQLYSLAATTNLALPFASWPVLSTGTVPFGLFLYTDFTAINFPQRFYHLDVRPL